MQLMNKVFLALDNLSRVEIHDLLRENSSKISLIKIGMEIFYKYGPEIISEIDEKYQVDIFLDLKLHDIPNTVYKSIKSLTELPIKFLTVHLSGGEEMLEAAKNGRDKYLPQAKLLGVSILTSISENQCEEMWNNSYEIVLKNFVRQALKSQLDGIIISPLELLSLDKLDQKRELLRVCPGIRLEGDKSHDQKRIMEPQKALRDGADYLVIGRSITSSDNPSLVIDQINKIISK